MMKRFFWLPVLVIALDQVSKIMAVKYLFHKPAIEVLPFFNFSLAFNTGSAFGFLHNASGWQNIFFITVAVIVSAVIVYMVNKLGANDKEEAVGLLLVLGGALGNVIDRVRLHKVVDFLDFYVNNWHWPTFNIADSAITIGAIILILDSFGIKILSGKKQA
jgi:signal peptidase II